MSDLVVGEAENGEVVPGLYHHPEGGEREEREGREEEGRGGEEVTG